MNTRINAFAALFLLAASSQALAVKVHLEMTPERMGDDLTFRMSPLDNGTTRFTITRNPAMATRPTHPDLMLVRSASLSVSGEKGLIVRCGVAPQHDKSGNLVYEFDIDNAHARRSRFTLAETEDHRRGGGYLGGGTIYTFSLIDFIDPKHKEKELLMNLQAARD